MKKSLAISMIILLMSLISYSAKSYDVEEKDTLNGDILIAKRKS